MIELEHSPLGGSAATRFINCTGSFLLQREEIENGEYENIPSEFASRGTAAHELGAVCIATDADPYEFLGERFGVSKDSPEGYLAGWPGGIDLDAVTIYVNDCRAIMQRANYGGLAIVEKTYTAPHLHPLLKGTVDFAYVTMSGLWLRDYKNGEGIGVRAAGNRQLLYYAFLLLVNMTEFGEEHWTRDTPVNLGIVQPNFWGLYEEPEVWETTLGEVWDWGYRELLPRMKFLTDARDIDAHDFVSGDHCQFCPVLLSCPTMQRAFEEYADASEDFVTMLTNEELDRLYAMRENARRFMNVLETTVHARLVTGGSVPSAKLVEKRVNREWKPGASGALVAALGEKAYVDRKLKSPAQIEKMSSRGKEIALEYGYKPESHGYSVAPIGDPRPEAKMRSNATTFEAHAQSPVDAGF